MRKANFLNKLKRKGKLELTEPSKEIEESYLKKGDDCLKSARILLQNSLYENSVTEAYYAMYNCLLALLYMSGIKSENHSASMLLLRKLFRAEELSKSISFAKEERIDKQYYVEAEQRYKAGKESCNDIIIKAERFMIGIKLLIDKITTEEITKIRTDFRRLLKEK